MTTSPRDIADAINILRDGIIAILNDGTPSQVGPTPEDLNDVLTVVIDLADVVTKLRESQRQPGMKA